MSWRIYYDTSFLTTGRNLYIAEIYANIADYNSLKFLASGQERRGDGTVNMGGEEDGNIQFAEWRHFSCFHTDVSLDRGELEGGRNWL